MEKKARMDVQKGSVMGTWLGRMRLGQVKPETRQGHVLLCVALWSTITFLVAHQFVITTVVVEGKSMMPTLKPGDCCVVNCLLPRFRGYKRGDVVVIRDADGLIVKRIVGLPHDHVQFSCGRVYVNNQRLAEPYLQSGTQTYWPMLHNPETLVADSSYFVMGDNRLDSEDSRFFGDVKLRDLVGIISR